MTAKAQKELTTRFPAGETQVFNKSQPLIYGVGQSAFDFYRVVSGRVAVAMYDDQGDVTCLRVLQVGDFFDEDSLARVRRRRREFARAMDNDTKIISWSGLGIRNLMFVDSMLANDLVDLMLDKVAAWQTLFHMDRQGKQFKKKLTALLLKMAKRGVRQGDWFAIPPVTHEMFGRMLGTSREIVTHAMGLLRRSGYVRYDRKGIWISVPNFESFKATLVKKAKVAKKAKVTEV